MCTQTCPRQGCSAVQMYMHMLILLHSCQFLNCLSEKKKKIRYFFLLGLQKNYRPGLKGNSNKVVRLIFNIFKWSKTICFEGGNNDFKDKGNILRTVLWILWTFSFIHCLGITAPWNTWSERPHCKQCKCLAYVSLCVQWKFFFAVELAFDPDNTYLC